MAKQIPSAQEPSPLVDKPRQARALRLLRADASVRLSAFDAIALDAGADALDTLDTLTDPSVVHVTRADVEKALEWITQAEDYRRKAWDHDCVSTRCASCAALLEAARQNDAEARRLLGLERDT
jgi:heterodisulfide reductase subunit B